VSECVFCMIAEGNMSAKIVYEDEVVIAFDDIMPQAPIHTLIIPRKHYDNLSDDVPVDVISALFSAVPKIAEIMGVDASGYRVIANAGKDASQTVGHLHVHVLGGRAMSHGMVRFESEGK